MRKNRYLKTGDLIPAGAPKEHIRSDDGRKILYWTLPTERVFLQAYDSLGNYRVLDGVVQAPKKVYTCAVCRQERSPDQVCNTCRAAHSVNGVLPGWVLELVKIQDRAIQNGYQVQSLDAFPTGPPLKASRWPLHRSTAFVEALEEIETAQREVERSSSFSSGITLSDHRQIEPSLPPRKGPRWNGYRIA